MLFGHTLSNNPKDTPMRTLYLIGHHNRRIWTILGESRAGVDYVSINVCVLCQGM